MSFRKWSIYHIRFSFILTFLVRFDQSITLKNVVYLIAHVQEEGLNALFDHMRMPEGFTHFIMFLFLITCIRYVNNNSLTILFWWSRSYVAILLQKLSRIFLQVYVNRTRLECVDLGRFLLDNNGYEVHGQPFYNGLSYRWSLFTPYTFVAHVSKHMESLQIVACLIVGWGGELRKIALICLAWSPCCLSSCFFLC